MSYILGVILSYVFIRLSLGFLDQNFSMYFDDVALSIVVGCTFAVGIIVLPWSEWRGIIKYLKTMVVPQSLDGGQVVSDCLKFTQSSANGSPVVDEKKKQLAYQLLRDGKELLELK